MTEDEIVAAVDTELAREHRRRWRGWLRAFVDGTAFWASGNDGLTNRERRELARQWREGLGSTPSLAASQQALKLLRGQR